MLASGKGRILELLKRSVIARLLRREKGKYRGGFEAAKLFCMIRYDGYMTVCTCENSITV